MTKTLIGKPGSILGLHSHHQGFGPGFELVTQSDFLSSISGKSQRKNK